MKTCIIGAGAIGAYLGTRLVQSGQPVSVLARGETARVLREDGWTLTHKDAETTVPVEVLESTDGQSPVDLLIITLKEPALRSLAPSLKPLIGPDTIILPAMNGVLWWFFEGLAGPLQGHRLSSVDPDGVVSEALPPSQVLGCVVHVSCTNLGHGRVNHVTGDRLFVGEPDGSQSDRLTRVVSLLKNAGIDVVQSDRIQNDVWYKLWGNMTMNPVSALTLATCDRILDSAPVSRFILAVMDEASQIGAQIGCPIAESGEERNRLTRKLGAFKTSMLQDVEAGKALEIDALLSTVHEIAQEVGIQTSHMDILLGLISLMGESRGLYQAPGA